MLESARPRWRPVEKGQEVETPRRASQLIVHFFACIILYMTSIRKKKVKNGAHTMHKGREGAK